jgi:hypothetical protein
VCFTVQKKGKKPPRTIKTNKTSTEKVKREIKRGNLVNKIPPGTWTSTVGIVCFEVEVFATGRSLVQRSLTECLCLTEFGYENLNLKRPRPTGGGGGTIQL